MKRGPLFCCTTIVKRGTLFCCTNIVSPLPQVKPLSMLECALLIALSAFKLYMVITHFWDYHITYRVPSGIVAVVPPPLYF